MEEKLKRKKSVAKDQRQKDGKGDMGREME